MACRISSESIPKSLDEKVRTFLPGYMTMGQDGMADMGEMGMKTPRNSVPMVGAPGPHDYITMGGLIHEPEGARGLGRFEARRGKGLPLRRLV